MRLFYTALLCILLPVSSLYAADHAVVLLYHHVSLDTPPATSITPELFREHLKYLEKHDFTVLPLGYVLRNLEEGNPLPDRTVSITFDDAYRSVLYNAVPLLKKKDWPFTVFVNTLAIDKGYRHNLGWDELRKVLDAGGEIGNHSHSHAHLVRRLGGETDQQWRKRIVADIEYARARLQAELAVHVDMFAYPYGEHTPELQELIDSLGYFGIAQQSGAMGKESNALAVPRFPMSVNYGDMERFAVSVYSRPLPVVDVAAGSVVQVAGKADQNRFSFTLLPGEYRPESLACYSGSGEMLVMEREEKAGAEMIIVHIPDWSAGRQKINCTASSLHDPKTYFWYSHLWLVKTPVGEWYQE